MTLAASGTLEAGTKYKHLPTLVCGEALRHFDWFSDYVEGTETLNVDYIIRGLAHYPLPLPCKFSVQTKARHAPCNEKTTCSNCKRLCDTSN